MDPVRPSLDWKLVFLREFADFLQQWEMSGRRGLSREMFLALHHSCLALSECASFLLDCHGFKYMLLGHLQSDAIESRFSWLRQLAGANYYLSMRQVLEGDKKIRALSLLKFSHFSLADLDVLTLASGSQSDSTADSVADALADAMKYTVSPSAGDANIVFYVTGAIARSVIHCTKCDNCRNILIDPDALTTLELYECLGTTDCSLSTFFETINRGGLTRPADYTFLLCIHCWRVFEEIRTNKALMTQFLGVTLGDMLSVEGDADAAVETRIRIGWNKFKQLVALLTNKDISLIVRGRRYSSCV